jgi:hypothetical protein
MENEANLPAGRQEDQRQMIAIAIGRLRGGLDFFFVILRITFLHQGKK